MRRDTFGRFGNHALDLMHEWATDNRFPMWLFEDGTGGPCDWMTDLNAGELSAGWALAYDWLYNDMSPQQRTENEAALTFLLENMEIGFWEAWIDNNHVAIYYGGRGLAAMTIDNDPEADDNDYYDQEINLAATRVRGYLDAAYQVDGAGLEGIMYSQYGMNIALPFALATDRQSALPGHQRMEVATERSVQQAGNWLVYELLPYYRYGGTFLNDTFMPPWDMHPRHWRSWPWLIAFANPQRPSAAKHLWLTSYTPSEMEVALDQPFDPADPDANEDAPLFSNVPGYQCGSSYSRPDGSQVLGLSNFAVLLSWPDDSVPSGAFLDPADMPSNHLFRGRGLAFFRKDLFHLTPSGDLLGDPTGWLMTFECRAPANWNHDGVHYGHSQRDVGQFTIYTRGRPMFYDCGYEHMEDSDVAQHNLCQVYDNGVWKGYEDEYPENIGDLIVSMIGEGGAPSLLLADHTQNWDQHVPPLVDRAQRSFIVVPRGGHLHPYVVLYDGFDFTGSSARKIRWFWHSSVSGTEDPDGFTIDGTQATITACDAGASATVLYPTNATVSNENEPYDVPAQGVPSHWRLQVETPVATTSNLTMLLETYGLPGDPTLVAEFLPTLPPSRAYRISDGSMVDVLGIRPAHLSGTWSFNIEGKKVTTDAQCVFLRFSSPDLRWEEITTGMLARGTRVWFDEQFVMGVDAILEGGSMTFSSEKVVVEGGGLMGDPGYFVGPLIPLTAEVNGNEGPVQMLDVPHPLTSTFPNAVGRSPMNDQVDPEVRYDVTVTLRNWAGAPIVNWPANDFSMDIVGCANPQTSVPPDGPSDAEGVVVWHQGLDSGGSCEISGGRVVKLSVDFDGSGFHLIRGYESITSPDEDGDSDIDLDDRAILINALTGGEPLYQGDMDLNGTIQFFPDYTFWFSHYRPGPGIGKAGSSASVEEDAPAWMRQAQSDGGVLLGPAMPSPAVSSVTIPFALPSASETTIEVFDINGRLVRTLVQSKMMGGINEVRWNGLDDSGRRLGAGVYYYRLQALGKTLSGRAVLMR